MNILFLYINAYSSVGGIQKFNQNFLHALKQLNAADNTITSLSLSDKTEDLPHAAHTHFNTADGSRMKFLMKAVKLSLKSDVVVFGHINLFFPLILILKILLRKKIVLITHGIEIWRPLGFFTKKCLSLIDTVITVSNFTKNKIIEIHNVPAHKIKILWNTLDPEFDASVKNEKPEYLMQRFGIAPSDKVILTVCRLVAGEKNKGYDKVIQSLKEIKKQIPGVKYLLAGKYDLIEKQRLDNLIEEHALQQQVIFSGYIKTEELPDIYSLCDVFIMPSSKEGFGIVFLEALVKGKPVIAGNKDGSVDALLNGELGLLIDPEDQYAITTALVDTLSMKADSRFYNVNELHDKTINTFGMKAFTNRINDILIS
ncbi:glycosyltransferase family 4 protein [Cytophaga hutchinsonii]|nr:glycosyltransferase family 4 protein [Cytophaga hutchinsonii]SFY02629.1 Glycosyltransferase involved in cell wall bisynthesis [Cytophaga hutchinsonii ATCC 33406]